MSPISQDILDGLPHEFSVKLEDIRMTPAEFDAFCSSEPHVVRSLKGHCFEAWFDDLLTRAGYHCEEIGGDSLFDRRVNGKTLQLKTPYQRGTVDGVKVSYRMHKTHGPERFPDVLYRREDFADFLVGHRRGNDVLICPAANMPLKKEVQKKSPWPDYIADPTPFNWNCEWVNRYDLIGVDAKRISADESGDSLFFPAIARAVGFNDVYIVKAILVLPGFLWVTLEAWSWASSASRGMVPSPLGPRLTHSVLLTDRPGIPHTQGPAKAAEGCPLIPEGRAFPGRVGDPRTGTGPRS